MDWPTLLNTNRRRRTSSSDDHRTAFDRDFDRSIFSTPLKRLQDKAQVFPLETHDAVRTRLTHSLEVSSVARGLATRCASWLVQQEAISPEFQRPIEVIAATCGLIHDLGNPPFGHAGENAIRAWFQQDHNRELLCTLLDDQQEQQDFLKFEGNAQSLRLVARLQILADDTGLNLTFGTLSALAKYIAPSHKADGDHPNHACRKPGYFKSEADIVAQIRDETGTGNARNPICFLVEAADDIVYLPADIEDAVKKHVLSWSELEAELKEHAHADSVKASLDLQQHILTVNGVHSGSDLDDDIRATVFRTAAIRTMVDAVCSVFQNHYDDIMHGRYVGTLLKDSDANPLRRCLRRIGETRVYPTRSTLTLELMGYRVIGDLMDVFWKGAQELDSAISPKTSTFPGKAAALFSNNYLKVFQQARTGPRPSLPLPYHQLQIVTDYVCGMTDSFATRLHADLFNGN